MAMAMPVIFTGHLMLSSRNNYTRAMMISVTAPGKMDEKKVERATVRVVTVESKDLSAKATQKRLFMKPTQPSATVVDKKPVGKPALGGKPTSAKSKQTPAKKKPMPAKEILTPKELERMKILKGEKFQKDIADYLLQHQSRCLRDWANRSLLVGMKPLCPCLPNTLLSWRNISKDWVLLNQTAAENPDVQAGGHWEPKQCTARYRVAIIIPFRNRDYHLSVLLHYLHPMLRGQMLNYTIIVVEQNHPEVFNKASLMNIAFKYASEQLDPDCVIFHDVDIIPEDGRHFYTCRDLPLHLGAYHSRHKYRLIYGGIFGAVTSFKPATFRHINGYSNRFFGWGGEDDEMSNRLHEHRLRIQRNPRAVAGYTALVHTRDKGNEQRHRSYMIFKAFKDRDTRHDGLNSLRFVFEKRRLFKLYTWLLVNVMNDETKIGFDLSRS